MHVRNIFGRVNTYISVSGHIECMDKTVDYHRQEYEKKNTKLHQDQNRAVELVEQWLSDRSGYDETVWPELKRSLDKSRLGERRLFHE